MVGALRKVLKGRDVRALRAFGEQLEASLGGALSRLALLEVRRLELEPLPDHTAEATSSSVPPPPPPPPTELVVLVELTRRDVLADAAIDQAAFEASRKHGALLSPVAATERELRSPEVTAGAFGQRLANAEPLP
ncbi:MAG: hypothetical protein D6776_03970 [Planctomycetota bacterium]|nr:MAG: hypothetical protein D6776_03970 [Planctomycetota bacterium]